MGDKQPLFTRHSRFRATPNRSLDQISSRKIVEYGDLDNSFLTEISNEVSNAFNQISNTNTNQVTGKQVLKTKSVLNRLGPIINDTRRNISNTGYGNDEPHSLSSESLHKRVIVIKSNSASAFGQLKTEQEDKRTHKGRKRTQNSYENDTIRKKRRLSDTDDNKVELSNETNDEIYCGQINSHGNREFKSAQCNRNSLEIGEREGQLNYIRQYSQGEHKSFQSNNTRRSRSRNRRECRSNDERRSRSRSRRAFHHNEQKRSRSGSHGPYYHSKQKRSKPNIFNSPNSNPYISCRTNEPKQIGKTQKMSNLKNSAKNRTEKIDSLELTTSRNVNDTTQKEEIFEMIKSAKNGKGKCNDMKERRDNILKILPNLDEIDSMLTLQDVSNFENAGEYLQRLFLVHRQDFIIPLCRGLNCLKKDLCHDSKCLQKSWRNDNVRVFKGIKFVVRCCSEQDGITVKVSFDVTPYRRVNWKSRKILMYGSLVCLVDKDFTFLQYATVSCRNELGLGMLDIKADRGDELVDLLLNKSDILLVESQAFYPSYFHTLNSIKETYEAIKENNYSLPLSKELLAVNTKPDLPDYFETEKFKEEGFNLSCICNSHYPNIDISNEGNWPCPSTVGLDESQYQAMVTSMKSKLALIQGPPGTGKTIVGLKIAEVLIHNEHVWRNSTNKNMKGPILLLSFTNHALDQFLLDILKMVPQLKTNGKVVRLGLKSEVEEIKKLNLTAQRREKYTYRKEQIRRRGKIHFRMARDIKSMPNIAADEARKGLQKKQAEHENLKKMKKDLHTGIVNRKWLYLIGVMTKNHYCQLQNGSFCKWLDLLSCVKKGDYQNQEDMYESDSYNYIDKIETYKPQLRNLASKQLIMEVPSDLGNSQQSNNNQNPFWAQFNTDEKILLGQFIRDQLHNTKALGILNCPDIWKLCIPERWQLYKYWIEQASIHINRETDKCEKGFKMAQKRYLEIQKDADEIILQNAKLIACTTTRAARDINILRKVSPSIVLMEEAAEIPEHHVIASLTSSCQQLIMIGDHQQLRPSFNDYKTAKKYNLNISLFERLINNGHPYKQLKYQHRMRPSFSRLLVPCIYKCLYDDDSVLGREHVKGMQKDLFFISHSIHEDSDREKLSHSHKNTHEATYIGQLYKYLRLQGYMGSEITVLCTYLDQVRLLRSIIKPIEDRFDANEQKTRITSVDNFQGEENDIILLSLVRSNEMGKIGYLHEANRICVALSRAKKGLYVIGNFEQLAARSQTWENIIKKAKEDGHMGFDLDLVCTKHNNVTTIKRIEDFHQVVDGGCQLQEPCGYRRECGHFCSRKCHTNDADHFEKCKKQCKLKCENGVHELKRMSLQKSM